MSWLRPLDQQTQACDACSGQGPYSEEMHHIPAGDESIGFARLLLAKVPFVAVQALEAVCIKATSQSTCGQRGCDLRSLTVGLQH